MAKTFVKEFEDWLLMDRWSVLQSCMILSGYFYKELGNSNSALIRISNGQKVKPQSNLGEFKRVSGLWKASDHPVWEKSKRDGVPIFEPVSADVNDVGKVRPCYVVNWAAKKGIEIPWLVEAKDLGFKADKPQLKKGNGTPIVLDGVSQTKIDNELRVWGHLLKVVKEAYKCDQKTLIAKIQASVDPDELRNKGLGERKISEAFAKANKVLEDDNDLK